MVYLADNPGHTIYQGKLGQGHKMELKQKSKKNVPY